MCAYILHLQMCVRAVKYLQTRVHTLEHLQMLVRTLKYL